MGIEWLNHSTLSCVIHEYVLVLLQYQFYDTPLSFAENNSCASGVF